MRPDYAAIKTAVDELLILGTEDWCSTLDLENLARKHFAATTNAELRVAVLAILQQALERNWVVVGEIGQPFEPWNLGLDETIVKLQMFWPSADSAMPEIGSFWTSNTISGDARGKRLLAKVA